MQYYEWNHCRLNFQVVNHWYFVLHLHPQNHVAIASAVLLLKAAQGKGGVILTVWRRHPQRKRIVIIQRNEQKTNKRRESARLFLRGSWIDRGWHLCKNRLRPPTPHYKLGARCFVDFIAVTYTWKQLKGKQSSFFTFERASWILPGQVCHLAYLPGWRPGEKTNMDPCSGMHLLERRTCRVLIKLIHLGTGNSMQHSISKYPVAMGTLHLPKICAESDLLFQNFTWITNTVQTL